MVQVCSVVHIHVIDWNVLWVWRTALMNLKKVVHYVLMPVNSYEGIVFEIALDKA